MKIDWIKLLVFAVFTVIGFLIGMITK